MNNSEYHKYYEVKAGIFDFNGDTKEVKALQEEGKIVIYHDKQNEKHFQWINSQGHVQFDIYLFQGDATFEPVYNDPSRVGYLYFMSYDDKYFFWLVDNSQSMTEVVTNINDVINADDYEEIEEQNVQQNSQQVIQPQNNVDPSLFQRFAQQINLNQKRLKLREIVNAELIQKVMNEKEMSSLCEHLPEGQQSKEDLKTNLMSAQFQQALDSFEAVLRSEDGATILYSMGLDGSSFYNNVDGLQSLLDALEKYSKQ